MALVSIRLIRLKYIELIAFMETWLAGLCFVVGIKWLIGLSIALFAIPLWGLISHRRWCRAHNEPYANWELFYTVIAWIEKEDHLLEEFNPLALRALPLSHLR